MFEKTCLWYMKHEEKFAKWNDNKKALEQCVTLRTQREAEAILHIADVETLTEKLSDQSGDLESVLYQN